MGGWVDPNRDDRAASAKDHDDDDGDFGIVLGGTTGALLFFK